MNSEEKKLGKGRGDGDVVLIPSIPPCPETKLQAAKIKFASIVWLGPSIGWWSTGQQCNFNFNFIFILIFMSFRFPTHSNSVRLRWQVSLVRLLYFI